MTVRALLAALALSLFACGGDDDDSTPLPMDGNVIVGMDRDGGPRDAGPPRDGGPQPDAGFRDGGDRDGGTRDGGPLRDGGPADAGDVCDVTPTATLTAEETLAEASMRDGTIVEVVGTATRTPYACTELPCPKENPCCNTCAADIIVDGVLPLAADACFGPRVGCAGTECAQTCQPALLGLPNRFVGRIVDGMPPRLDLYRVTTP